MMINFSTKLILMAINPKNVYGILSQWTSYLNFYIGYDVFNVGFLYGIYNVRKRYKFIIHYIQ